MSARKWSPSHTWKVVEKAVDNCDGTYRPGIAACKVCESVTYPNLNESPEEYEERVGLGMPDCMTTVVRRVHHS